jgi:tRNA threonylcarbamoyladenosine biosynthesis protein TsaB
MLLIAIDTSGRNGSVALCRCNENSFDTLQLVSLEGGTYSARLMPTIADLLAAHGLSKEQVDAFVIVSGPGSFTGLRVGIATVKGLCEVLQKPLVAVSMLEAVAIKRGHESLKAYGFSRAESAASNTALAAEANITVALDAGRSEVYVGDFEIVGSCASLVREYIAKIEVFSADAASSQAIVLTPDSKVADSLRTSGAAAQLVNPVHADEIGRLGLSKLLRGEVVDPATLDANYIRRSDAELFSPKR